jgi:hypothetical protein
MCVCLEAQNWNVNQKHTVSINKMINSGTRASVHGTVPLKYAITNNNLPTYHMTISLAAKVQTYKHPLSLLHHQVEI